MKMKLTAVLSVILCVTGTFAASNADYVQDGLVTHFDAIDNAGTGAHVSNAAQWRDLKGSASIALVSGASWSDTYLNSGTTRHSIANMPAYDRDSMTLEAVVNVISNGPPSGNYWPRIFADGEWFSIHFTRNGTKLCQFMKGNPDGAPECRVYGVGAGENFRTGTLAGFSGSDSFGIAIDGLVNVSADYIPSATAHRPANAGWTLNGYGGWLHGHYYGLRFYNRKLGKDELLQNAVIDKIRYWNTYPAGYRDSGGVLQKRMLVAKPTGCVLEVDGVAQAGDFEDWSAFGTRATYTLTATPESGYQFQRWAGDMDCITSGNLYSNTITVARSLAMSFTPVFTAIPEPVLASPVYTITVASGTRELTTAVDDNNTAIGTTGWDDRPWHDGLEVRGRTVEHFRRICRDARRFAEETGVKRVCLAPLQEWGEGSYAEPNGEYGFGMFEAVRDAFCEKPAEGWPLNYTPADIGRGPYPVVDEDGGPAKPFNGLQWR